MNESPERTLALLEAFREIARTKPVLIRVRGACMAPLIADGAVVEVSAPQKFYWPGDVVVVANGQNSPAVHRVIGVFWRRGDWKFMTQGDAATCPDSAVPSSQILGKVCGGECSEVILQVPLRQRLRALFRFLRFSIRHLITKRLA